MNDSDPKMDEQLDALFAEAADELPELSSTFMSRLAVDAKVAMPRKQVSVWRRVLSELGGWPALGGLATATAAGVYLGIMVPSLVSLDMQLDSADALVSLVEDDLDAFLVADFYDFEEG